MQKVTRKRGGKASDSGVTLVELLVVVAISVVIIGIAFQLLMGATTVNWRVRQQTNQYESLRLAASLFQADAQMSRMSALHCTTTSMVLYANPPEAIEYTLQPNSSGTYDLHRLHWNSDPYTGGGSPDSDNIVASGINQPTQNGDAFGCAKSPNSYPQGEYTLTLEKPLISGQSVNMSVQVVAFPRNK